MLSGTSVQAQGTDPRQISTNILVRAWAWVDNQVPYDQNGYRDGYRTDCSGFASYAWGLQKNGNPFSATTVTLSTYSVEIPFDALQPGDIVNNKRPGNKGHVVIFVRWITQTQFVAYEENGAYGAVQTELSLAGLTGGGRTIAEYQNLAPGPYYAQRYKGIPGFVNVISGLYLSSTNPKTHENVTASFRIRNDGGRPVTISQLTTAVRGPAAKANQWKAPVVDFPSVKGSIVLEPGQVYTYSGTRAFSSAGDYFAEPVKDQNGWGGIWPWPRVWFDVKGSTGVFFSILGADTPGTSTPDDEGSDSYDGSHSENDGNDQSEDWSTDDEENQDWSPDDEG